MTICSSIVHQDKVVLLIEGKDEVHVISEKYHVAEPGAVAFPHSGKTHMLRMSGTVSVLKQNFPLDVWLNDEIRGTDP